MKMYEIFKRISNINISLLKLYSEPSSSREDFYLIYLDLYMHIDIISVQISMFSTWMNSVTIFTVAVDVLPHFK